MSIVDSIQEPIKTELRIFEDKFRKSMKSEVPLLDKITHYIIKRKGKQLRPMFVLLSSKLFAEVNESSYRAASLIELLHTATLVHDDVVDDARMRRGFFSINALWKNKIAVLVGDYLLSRGLLLSVNTGEFEMLRIVSKAVEQMSEGELLQMEKTRSLDISEEVYFEIIRKKTASLIASCCAAGTQASGVDKQLVDMMWDFGENVGIAFQIKDDLFDYGVTGEEIGKPTGIDLQEKKLTLPLIYALNKASKSEKRQMINIVKNHAKEKKRVDELVKFVQEKGGFDYAQKTMLSYHDKAMEILKKMPDGVAKTALSDLVNYTINRKK